VIWSEYSAGLLDSYKTHIYPYSQLTDWRDSIIFFLNLDGDEVEFDELGIGPPPAKYIGGNGGDGDEDSEVVQNLSGLERLFGVDGFLSRFL